MDWKLMWRRFRLLLWKNMVIRRRNFKLTCAEICLTPVTTAVVFLMCIYAPDPHHSSSQENLNNQTIREASVISHNNSNVRGSNFPDLPLLHVKKEISPCDWIIPLNGQGENYSIGFTPNSREAHQIAEKVIEAIESYNCSHGNHLLAFPSGSFKADGFDTVQDMKLGHLQREITFNMNRNEDTGRKMYVGIAFKGICKEPCTFSYKIWHRKEREIDEKIERQDIIMHYGAKWKKQMHQANSQNSFSRKEELKRASFQIIFDKVLVRLLISRNSSKTNQSLDFPQNMDISLASLPQNSTHGKTRKQPKLELQRASKVLGLNLPLYCMIFLSIVLGVVNEKKSQLKSLMTLMGIPRWMHTLCWFVDGMVIGCTSGALLVSVYKIRFGDLGFKDATAICPHSDWTPLFFIFTVYVIHGLSLSFFVSSFFNTAHVAIVAMFTITLSLSHALTINLAHFSSFQRAIAVMLFPNCGTGLLEILFADLELKGAGLHWSSFCDELEMVDSMTILHFLSLQIGMSVVYFLLAEYMENVLLQDSYGVAKPFYYPFLLLTWFRSTKKDAYKRSLILDRNCGDGSTDKDKEPHKKSNEFELEPAGVFKAGVLILGLTKEFSQRQNGKKKRVVDDFRLNLLQGQITVLLGHNGSGKSTLISMLTGLTKPTTGTAVFNDYDLNLEMKKIHKDMGFCPQKNVLFNDLSVAENLQFFGQLKGLRRHQIDEEKRRLVEALALQEKENTPAKFLSGGQKRKLQLAISLISNSKVVFLDEPTSEQRSNTGMDPETRRLVWNFLLEIRKKRTVLLTTHFMEEAEVCGDRIAIMESGRLKYCGTSFFLKRLFGTGYTLHLTLNQTETPSSGDEYGQVTTAREQILAKVRHFIKDARVKPRFVHSNVVMDIILPMIVTDNYNGSKTEGTENLTVCSKIPLLLRDLTDSQQHLKIKKLALFVTTMDDVFSSALGENHLMRHVSDKIPNFNGTSNVSSGGTLKQNEALSYNKSLASGDILLSVSPLKVTLRQAYALLKRRLEYNWNYKLLITAQFMITCSLMLFSATLVQNKIDELWVSEEDDGEEWHDIGGLPIADLKFKRGTFKGCYSPIVKGSAQLVSNRVANSTLTQFQRITQTLDKDLSMNVMRSGAFRSLDDYDVLKRIEKTSLDTPAKFLDIGFLFVIGLTTFHSSFLILPLQEKQTWVKHLELMTGLSPLVYWSSLLIWDFFLCSVLTCINITIIIIMEGDLSIAKHGGLVALGLTMSVVYFTGIAFAYLLTCFITSPASGLFAFIVLCTIGGQSFICSQMSGAFDNLTSWLHYFLQYILKLFAPMGFIPCIEDFYPTAIINSRCSFVPEFIKNITCDHMHQKQQLQNQYQKEWIFQLCCENMKMKSRSFLEWNVKNSSVVTNLKSFDGFGGFQGLGQELVIVFTVGLLHLVLTLAIDYKTHEKVSNQFLTGYSQRNRNQTNGLQNVSKLFTNLDPDVQNEQERVKRQAQTNNSQEDAFLCVDLCKTFGSLPAVSNLSFGVHRGECFGLLGVNGAGKSTTFSMLTGRLKPSRGNAFINNKSKTRRGLSLLENEQQYLKNIGYCPQIDAVLPMLTGRQHLELFARLRGCSSEQTKIQAQRWLDNLGLVECADYQCGHYSGGMQRRLNTAMSMIANPSMILLDEPTSGVDPISRRQFWRLVASLKDSGQSVILTSHCMEECENLCSRLAIMVGGQIQCLGSPNGLRKKCPQGYVLKIQLRSESQAQPQVPKSTEAGANADLHLDKLKNLISQITKRFDPCTLQEFYQNRIQFSLANKEMSLVEAFNIMEEFLIQYSNQIQEYCLGEATLDQVFLAVATCGGFKFTETAQRNL